MNKKSLTLLVMLLATLYLSGCNDNKGSEMDAAEGLRNQTNTKLLTKEEIRANLDKKHE